MPDSITSIGNHAFTFCNNLTSVTIPNSVSAIGKNPFGNSPVEIHVSSDHPTLEVIDGVLFDKTQKRLVTYPYGFTESSYHIPQGTIEIGDNAFSNNTALANITIPDSVTSIGNNAFYFCSSLTDIRIPNSVISIGDSAFGHCRGLTSITIPDSVVYVGSNPFESVSVSIDVSPNHSTLSVIDDVLFEKESGRLIAYPYGSTASDYQIPQGILEIGDNAFHFSQLTKIVIPDSVTSIEKSAFGFCEGLTSVTIPESVFSVGKYAFNNCNNLTNVVISNGVTSIGDNAFQSCDNLTSITIPESVVSIGSNPFAWTSVRIDVSSDHPALSVVDGVLFDKESRRLIAYPHGSTANSYEIPLGTTEIGSYAFCEGKDLTSVTIPDSVTSIGDYAFGFCEGLTNVTIPDGVVSIGGGAFSTCVNLENVTIPGSVASIGNYAFTKCSNLKTVTISRNCVVGKDAFPEDCEINFY